MVREIETLIRYGDRKKQMEKEIGSDGGGSG
jgi:hypothetical protein